MIQIDRVKAIDNYSALKTDGKTDLKLVGSQNVLTITETTEPISNVKTYTVAETDIDAEIAQLTVERDANAKVYNDRIAELNALKTDISVLKYEPVGTL